MTILNSYKSQSYMLSFKFVQNYTFTGGWVGVGGQLDYVVINPPKPSQAESRLGFWLGGAWQLDLGNKDFNLEQR